MTIEVIMKQVEGIETQMSAFIEKAQGELDAAGSVSNETKTAIEKIGEQQREVADRLLAIEQSGVTDSHDSPAITSWGKEFVSSPAYEHFSSGSTQKARFEVKNNISTGSDVTVAPDRKPGVVGGAFQILTLENMLVSLPTTSNAIEFTKETTFVNNAAETAEAAAKPETNITFVLVNIPVSTVAHWTKISRQLSADAPALAAYINSRMEYGVNQKTETELAVGNGTAPNISGLFDTGNYTVHGIGNAALPTTLKSLALIRKCIALLLNVGYRPNAILLNPIDFGEIEIDLMTTAGGQMLLNVNAMGQTTLFGVPVVQSAGVVADTFQVGDYMQGATVHNRQGVVVELSDSDSDNFTKNLVTVRAERRLALTVEKPAAIIGGDLSPV